MSLDKPFFVSGLPRSRTAWLSVFLDCHHEGMVGCDSLQEYKDKIKGSGDCLTTLSLIDVKLEFPDSKVIVIDSDVSKAAAFASKHYGIDISYHLAKHKEILDNIDCLHVNFNDIDKNLRKIWTYVRDEPYNDLRASRLKKLNIQIKNIDECTLNESLARELEL